LRALVVGLGQIGMGYDMDQASDNYVLTHCRAFQKHPRFELVGAVDEDASRRELFQRVYDLPAYACLQEALRSGAPDVVVVATPTPSHAAVMSAVLQNANPKAILCEKPLSYDFQEACEMEAACRSRGVGLYVNYMRRSDSGAAEVRNRILSGSLPPPLKGVCWYTKGLFNNGSHFLNLLEYWLGDVRQADILAKGRIWNGLDPEPDLRVDFEKGSIFFLALREEDYSHYSVEILGKNGRLSYDLGGSRILWQPALDDPVCRGYRSLGSRAEEIPNVLDRIQWHVADQLAAAMEGMDARICNGSEAVRTQKTLDQIQKSL
jgi:predicted dehydrogenase